jgi:ParB family chromosome partitioning protein
MTEPARRPGAGGLGRGLAALIPQRPATTAGGEIPIDRIRRNPYQPRQAAADADLERLAASVAEHGVLQPILVVETLDGYQLVAGERRLRAAELAGLTRIPAVIRQVRPRDQLELALVENLQRADLNPLEEARAYRQLVDEFGLSHDEVAAAVGRARPTIANTLRLLDLAVPVQEALADGSLSEGHGRALIGLPEAAQIELTAVIKARQLSVRETENLARRLKSDATGAARPARPTRAADPELERLAADLRTALGTKVTLTPSRRGGRIVIEYYDGGDLERIYEWLTRSRE